MSFDSSHHPHGSAPRSHMALVLQCCAAGARGVDRTYLKHKSIRRAQKMLLLALVSLLAFVLSGVLHEFWPA